MKLLDRLIEALEEVEEEYSSHTVIVLTSCMIFFLTLCTLTIAGIVVAIATGPAIVGKFVGCLIILAAIAGMLYGPIVVLGRVYRKWKDE